MRIHHRPGSGEARVVTALDQPEPGHDKEVVRVAVAELVPPVLAYDFGLVDFVNGPEMPVAVFVEEDGLEHVPVKVHVGRELGLVVCTVEAHFELGEVLVVHFDVVHWFEGLFGHFLAHGLVDAGEDGDGFVFVVEVFVVAAHVVRVVVGDGDVVGPLHGAEDLAFSPVASRSEDALGSVSPSNKC